MKRYSILSILNGIAFCGACLACDRAQPAPRGRDAASARPHERDTLAPAGTYRIAVCKQSACEVSDTASAVAWGTLVLLDSPVADSISQR